MGKANNYQENRLFILNDRQSLRINSELAMEIGLNESIVLLQLEYLASISGNAKDGKKWVYNSAQEWKDKYFGFWSIETIRRILNSLVKKGFLTEGKYNKKKYDKTRWFALNFDDLRRLNSIKVGADVERCGQNGERSGQDVETIPKTTTEKDNNNYEAETNSEVEDVLKYFSLATKREKGFYPKLEKKRDSGIVRQFMEASAVGAKGAYRAFNGQDVKRLIDFFLSHNDEFRESYISMPHILCEEVFSSWQARDGGEILRRMKIKEEQSSLCPAER